MNVWQVGIMITIVLINNYLGGVSSKRKNLGNALHHCGSVASTFWRWFLMSDPYSLPFNDTVGWLKQIHLDIMHGKHIVMFGLFSSDASDTLSPIFVLIFPMQPLMFSHFDFPTSHSTAIYSTFTLLTALKLVSFISPPVWFHSYR